MVCNILVGCISPPEWRRKLRESVGRRSIDKRQRFCGYTLTQFLISFASDADIASDYFYYVTVLSKRNVIPMAVTMALGVCLGISTFLWFLEVLEGRMGCKKCCNIRLTNTNILLAAVFLEDIPQIVLTALIELRYLGNLSIPGLLNIAASVHNALIKIQTLVDGNIDEDWKEYSEPLLEVQKPSLTREQVERLSAEI